MCYTCNTESFSVTVLTGQLVNSCSYDLLHHLPSLAHSSNCALKKVAISSSRNGSVEPSKTKTTQCGTSLSVLSQKNLCDVHQSLEKILGLVCSAPSRYIPRSDNCWTSCSSAPNSYRIKVM